MNKIHKLISMINAPTKFFVTGAILIAVIQVPVMPQVTESVLPIRTAHVMAGEIETGSGNAMSDAFFGLETPFGEAKAIVEGKMEFVRTRKAYSASLAVIQKHEKTIKTKAREKGVPEDVAIGVSLLENGGSETAVSSAGALGVFQLMPGTARNLGLTVNGKLDERRNPEKNIEGGVTYLRKNYDRFGDWGLSTWAYHAGEGNVAKALKIYAKANHGIDLPGVGRSDVLRSYVEKYGITVHKLLSDPSVQAFTKRLNDDSHGYPYKVVATAELFKQSKGTRTEVVAR